MTTKKKLITRLAVWTAAVLSLGLLGLVASLLVEREDHERFDRRQKSEREEVVEQSRQYLAETAQRIDGVPVDPNLVGEIESRYFEERARGPMQIWAVGTGGEFLFGVPRAAFDRLNAVYDREVTPRLKEGVFLDRQSFLLGHLGEGDDLDLVDEPLSEGRALHDAWSRLRGEAFRSDGTFVLSQPLKTADGAALGSLYLRRTAGEREYYRMDERLEVLTGVAGSIAGLAFVFLWILLPTWVYVDARERGVRRAPLFAFLTVISSLVGLVVYLIARPEDGRTLACPGCGREVNGGAFCPHCGRDLSAAFCVTCRYPLKPEWGFCPSCRTEIKAPPPTPGPPPAG